jgi:hypothetical protein
LSQLLEDYKTAVTKANLKGFTGNTKPYTGKRREKGDDDNGPDSKRRKTDGDDNKDDDVPSQDTDSYDRIQKFEAHGLVLQPLERSWVDEKGGLWRKLYQVCRGPFQLLSRW